MRTISHLLSERLPKDRYKETSLLVRPEVGRYKQKAKEQIDKQQEPSPVAMIIVCRTTNGHARQRTQSGIKLYEAGFAGSKQFREIAIGKKSVITTCSENRG